ncbi:intein C-terminal splicing region/intein N-terminal splicing region [Micromonospora phaseoli]|uniref:Intein C-terminal splicing region/intein N-terminal splicing region n=2 Tax=Micromonospora phaseoli TaxID=1144548 RepID=A0A1H7DL41_9ACTN|nr:intein/intein [Micromonospora phaseoli]SEK02509.1 intein C-terminal splicing region/intein N-terminal splicing region [Micromonospora phaseoli]
MGGRGVLGGFRSVATDSTILASLSRMASRAGSGPIEGINSLGMRLANAYCSFTPDTRVLMADGTTKPISKIKPGDEVFARDPETGEYGSREVTATWVHRDKVLKLTIDGETVDTTADHPFWDDSRRQWRNAGDLIPGDLLLSVDGQSLEVDRLTATGRAEVVYNLTVAAIHTYYVVAGNTPVLVHNCGTRPSGVIDLDAASASGATLQRGGYSVAGRALQKHADRAETGSNWSRPAGRENPQGWNSAGQDMLDDSLTNPDSVVHLGYGRVGGQWQDALDVRLPGGRGARFDLNGNFSGFLD